ncbi:MAG: FGGY family carbohydrate kinase [Chitinophagaceae bacterium]
MLLLGIDLGTSFIKVSVVDAASQLLLVSATWPETEADISTPQPGWAEQHPDQWWTAVKQAIAQCHTRGKYDPKDIGAIGISYQMHGLVLTDRQQQVIRPAIIWCDSRAVSTGDRAFQELGQQYCLQHLLNSPGNFTIAKLAWVKENEPETYSRINQFMLPGDFIALQLTGESSVTVSGLSEGICWDFQQQRISTELLDHYGLDQQMIPPVQRLFGVHGRVKKEVAAALSLKEGIPVTYKAGDQLNNALALHVLQPGEVAATAGTSGVIYAVSGTPDYDPLSRVNSFAHVNYTSQQPRIGVLLCINGAGIFNRWIKQIAGHPADYAALNQLAVSAPAGAEGLLALPFGNGAERMLENKLPGAGFAGIDLNKHGLPHLIRAVQEGIAFAFRYGMDIMRENGMEIKLVRAAKANLFLSDVFSASFSNINNTAVEFYEGDGSYGAALGAGIGAGYYKDTNEAGQYRKPAALLEPDPSAQLEETYQQWKYFLEKSIYAGEAGMSLS